MLLVGLTGGIGSGKSTVARMLERRGAVVFDADDFARRAVEPRSPGFDRVVEEFGNDVLTADGGLDRRKLAAVVFADPDKRARLEAIVHPEVGGLLQEALEPYRETDRVVVYDVPLLVESHLESMFDVVVVVSAPEEVRVERLVERGMSDADARARIRAQISDEERNAAADVVISNDGSKADLDQRIEDLRLFLEAAAADAGGGPVDSPTRPSTSDGGSGHAAAAGTNPAEERAGPSV